MNPFNLFGERGELVTCAEKTKFPYIVGRKGEGQRRSFSAGGERILALNAKPLKQNPRRGGEKRRVNVISMKEKEFHRKETFRPESLLLRGGKGVLDDELTRSRIPAGGGSVFADHEKKSSLSSGNSKEEELWRFYLASPREKIWLLLRKRREGKKKKMESNIREESLPGEGGAI